MVDQPGSQTERPFGSRYLLTSHLGSGAMGQVWRAHARDGQPFAVKLLRSELAGDSALVARFLQEAKLLTEIRGSHLVRVHDLVAEGSELGIVMDLVDGEDLRSVVARGALQPQAAVHIVDGILAGLADVHEAGIVHRDVKPENVLLPSSAPTHSLLTDFGVAGLVQEGAGARRTTVIGTPEYLAPEVADGQVPTPSSDLYGVGIVLYELLCGVTPFVGGSPLAVLRRHVEQLPGRPGGVPDPLWVIASTLLAKDPSRRSAGARDVRSALAALPDFSSLGPAPTLATPPPPPVVDRRPTVLGNATVPMGKATASGRSVIAPPDATTEPATSGGRHRRGVLTAAAVAAVALVVAAGLVLWLPQRDSASANTAAAVVVSSTLKPPVTTTSADASPTTAASTDDATPMSETATTAALTNVPRVVGQNLADAQNQLEAVGVQVATNSVPASASTLDGTVTAQKPAAGTAVTSGMTVTLTVAREDVGTFLADMNRVAGEPSTRTVTVNSVSYAHALSSRTNCPTFLNNSYSVEYDLGRHYQTLKAMVGVTDDSAANAEVLFEVVADGRTVYSQTAGFGRPLPVKVSVTGVLRLRIVATRTNSTCVAGDPNTKAVWGDAEVFGLPVDVPPASTTPTG